MAEEPEYEKFFLISLDRIDDTQRKLIQAQVDRHAVSWWHQQSNVWIVQGGDSPAHWRNLLSPFVTGVPGSLFVFNMPLSGRERSFASYAQPGTTAWIKSTYVAPVAPRGEIQN